MSLAADINDSENITMDEVLRLAGDGQLRVRAFGECRYWGQGLVWGELNRNPVEMLEQVLGAGMMRVYSDDEGIFVGPHNPACVGA